MPVKVTVNPYPLLPFIFQAKQIKINVRHGFVDERQPKTVMPK